MKNFLVWVCALTSLHADPIRDFWYDGAEVSSFKLDQSRYGKNHPGHAELIFVTEPFLDGKQVKDEGGKTGSTSVLKLNTLTTFNTGIYSYRTMTSTFRPIDIEKFPHALKSVTTIQDWCGQAFQQLNYRDKSWNAELRSYFEDVADADLSLGNGFIEDELWVTLRLDPKKLPLGNVSILPGAVFTRFAHKPLQAAKASASLSQSDGITIYTLDYPSLERTLSIHFDTAFPHVIRKWTEKTPSGITTATLEKRLMNLRYWEMQDPKDSSERKKLGLEPVAD
ncbi:MAG: septum formation inhibitor Maf [Luteolibacter sp.]